MTWLDRDQLCGPAFENNVTIIYPIRANIRQNITYMSKVRKQQGGGLEWHDMVAAKKLNVARSNIKQIKILLQYSVFPPVYNILMRN